MHSVLKEYSIVANTPSDINEHIPVLRELSSQCESVLECGVRAAVSTWAFIRGLIENNSSTKKLYGSDLNDFELRNYVEEVCKNNSIQYQFFQKNDLEIEIEPVDLVFIDTWHVYGHLRRELFKFSKLAKKYIVLHDTVIDGEMGESIRIKSNIEQQSKESGYPIYEITKGLMFAVEEFLFWNKDWKVKFHYPNNNGLTVLCKTN